MNASIRGYNEMMIATLHKPDVASRLKRHHRELLQWKQDIEEGIVNTWQINDCLSKALFLYDRTLKLDFDYRSFVCDQPDLYEEAVDDQIHAFAAQWYEYASQLAQQLPPQVEGDEHARFLEAHRQMKNMLTPDDEFFTGPKLAMLETQALAEYRAGKTKPLVLDEFD